MDAAPSQDPQTEEFPSELIAAGEDGKVFSFTPTEDKFLVALSETHDVSQAVDRIGKDIAWARRFFAKPKSREWLSLKSRQHAARTGTTSEWWYSYGRAVLSGRFEWWEGECTSCHCKVKTYLEPLNESTMPCYLCTAPVLMNKMEIPIKPSREQIVVWQELGGRCVPKVERVQHEFTDSSFIFSERGDGHVSSE